MRFVVFGSIAFLFSAASAASAQTVEQAARRAASARVQPGDRIVLHVLREPELSDQVTVTERGDAPFPKLGVMTVASLSIAELQDTLRSRYAEFLRDPAVEVVVLRRIAVGGDVRNPEVYLVDVATTLRDIIAKAGGITEQGDRKKVSVVRNGQSRRIRNWESEQGPESDLLSGDQIIVGRKNWLILNFLPAVSTTTVVVSLIYSLTRR